MPFKTRIFEKISDISPEEWSAIYPDTLENYAFLKTLDESGFAQFSFFYIMVYEEGRAVGAAACFTMSFPLDMTVQGPFQKVLAALKKIAPSILSPKVLMCGIPMGQGRIGARQHPEMVISALEGALEEIARRERAALIIFKDFSLEDEALLKPLLKRGFSRIESLPSTDIAISFKSFEEYLQTLSPVSRSGLKRKFKKIDAQKAVELEIVDSLSHDALEEVHGLYLQTYNKHEDISIELVPREFFSRISQNMPGKVKFFLWRIKGKIAAFAFCLFSGEVFIDYYLGFDYALAYEHNLYFVRMRDLLKWCIAHGIKRYEMGVTGYEAKRRMGFRFIRLFFYMKHCHPFFNLFFGIFKGFFEPRRFDPVFKDVDRSSP